MLRLSPSRSELAVLSPRSPAILRPEIVIGLATCRALVEKALPLKTARIEGKRIPDCPAPGHSRATRPVSMGSSEVYPSRPKGGAGPACRRLPIDLLARKSDPTPAHPPRVSFASREIVTNNKTTRGSLLQTSLISAGKPRLTVGEGQGSASRDRISLSSFASQPIECDAARRLRLEAGFTPAVYDTRYQGPPAICKTR